MNPFDQEAMILLNTPDQPVQAAPDFSTEAQSLLVNTGPANFNNEAQSLLSEPDQPVFDMATAQAGIDEMNRWNEGRQPAFFAPTTLDRPDPMSEPMMPPDVQDPIDLDMQAQHERKIREYEQQLLANKQEAADAELRVRQIEDKLAFTKGFADRFFGFGEQYDREGETYNVETPQGQEMAQAGGELGWVVKSTLIDLWTAGLASRTGMLGKRAVEQGIDYAIANFATELPIRYAQQIKEGKDPTSAFSESWKSLAGESIFAVGAGKGIDLAGRAWKKFITDPRTKKAIASKIKEIQDASGTGAPPAPKGAVEGAVGGEAERLRLRDTSPDGLEARPGETPTPPVVPETGQITPAVTEPTPAISKPTPAPTPPVSAELPSNLFALKKIAKERGIDISDIKGPGAVARIKERLGSPTPKSEPQERFHGTSEPIDNLGQTFDQYQSQNLYGPGFYATDDVAVAESYTKKGKGKNPSVYRVEWIGEKKPVFIDLEKPLPPDAFKVIQDAVGDRATLDPNKAGRSVYSEAAGSLSDGLTLREEAEEILGDIKYNLNRIGYDGFTHVGGSLSKGKRHNVEIYFAPLDEITGKPNIRLTKTDKAPQLTTPTQEFPSGGQGTMKIEPEPAPVVPAGRVPTKGKQPWEMTREEFRENPIGVTAYGLPAKYIRYGGYKGTKQINHKIDINHYLRVKSALSEGKPVPPEVLADYPDLAAKKGKPPIATLKPERTGGEVGGPRQQATFKLHATAEDVRTGEQQIVKESQILEQLSKDLGTPIRSGHMGGKRTAEGFFRVKEEVIRNRRANDLVTASHEAGHAIEKMLFGDVRGNRNFPQQTKQELMDLGKALYGKSKPARGYISEGFSEYIRYHSLGKGITGVDIAKIAPNTTRYFNEQVLSNPQIKKALDRFSESGKEFYRQGSLNRVKSLIAVDKPKGTIWERFTRAKDKFIEMGQDDAVVMEKMERAIHGGELRGGGGTGSPTAMYRAMKGTADAKAQSRLYVGQFDRAGNKTGPALRDIFKDIKRKEYDDVIALAMAKRTIEKSKQGVETGVRLQDAQHVVDLFSGNKRFNTATEEIVKWNDSILQYLKDAGGLSNDAAKVIRDSNLMYIPFIRHFESLQEAASGVSKGGRFANLSSPIKAMRGSQRDIVHPVVAMADQATKIIDSADRFAVGRAFIEMVEGQEGLGYLGEKLAKRISRTKFSMAEIKGQLEKAGANLDDADLDSILNIFRRESFTSPKENIITLFRNGEKEVWQLDPEIYKVAMGTNRDLLPYWLTLVGGMPARAVRAGATGVSAGFTALNAVRDLVSALIHAPQSGIRNIPSNLKATFRGHGKAFGRLGRQIKGEQIDDPVMMAYLAGGGDFTSLVKLDRRNIRRTVDEILGSSAKRRAYNVVRHPIEALREVIGTTELGPRIGAFEKELRRLGWSEGKPFTEEMMVKAFNEASEITLNFRKSGTIGKEVNKLSAFFNAGIQGLSKTASVLKNNPKEAVATALATITAPSIFEWWMNKDEKWYQELQDWEKYGFWNFKVGDRIIKIPRPYEWGYIFGALPTVLLDSLYHKDPGQFKDFGEAFARQVIPNPTPNIVTLMTEWYSNKNLFTGNRIVSQYDEDNLEPYMQYQPWTTDTMKGIGKLFNLSPARIENAFNNMTGGFYRRVADPVEGILSAFGILPEHPQDPDVLRKVPIVGRFIKRNSPSTKSVEQFYDNLFELRQKKGTARKQKKPFAENGKLELLENSARMIQQWRRLAEKSKDPDEIRRLWDKIVDTARLRIGKPRNPTP